MPTIDTVLQKLYNYYMGNIEQTLARINLAKNQNKIINQIFKHLDDNEFNIDLDLSDIPSNKLKDFWLYTTGFISLINYENQDKLLNNDEALDILNGDFYVKDLSNEEVSEILNNAGIPQKMGGLMKQYDLFQVQDGKYSILESYTDGKSSIMNFLKLTTKPIHIYSKVKIQSEEHSYYLKRIRNCLAHGVPNINGNSLIYFSGNDEFVVSKMWLRGFAETFCMLNKPYNEEVIFETMSQALSLQGIYIDSEKDIDKALSSIKDLFDADIKKNYNRVTNFIKTRLKFEPEFYNKSFDEKVKSIACIIANNPNYIVSSTETINPSIIYNIQQLVAKELNKRNEDAYASGEDIGIEEIKAYNRACEDYDARVISFNKKNPIIRTQFQRNMQNKLINEGISLKNKAKKLKQQIALAKKIECSNMDLFNPDNLSHLPVETAVNLVWLLAFNNLVISRFFDDLLKNEDFKEMSKTKNKFFESFDFSKLNITYNDKKVTSKPGPSNIAFLLSSLRNALCHGLIEYKLPPVKKGENPTYKDTIMTFFTDSGSTIYGRLEDFYNLFNNENFTNQRKPEICHWGKNETETVTLIEKQPNDE